VNLPVVQLAFDDSEVAAGASTRLTWSVSQAATCMASGAWSGPQPSSGSIPVTQPGTGFYSYGLTCTNALGSASAAGTLSVLGGAKNVARVTVGRGIGIQSMFNIPFVDVTVCRPGTTSCQTIDHVLLDTGSIGLRIIAPDVLRTDLGLPGVTSASNKSLAQCVQFGDGTYLWGSLRTADVKIAGETARSVVIHEAADPAPLFARIPADCTGVRNGGSVAAFGAKAVLGIGTAKVDCAECVNDLAQKTYFECDATACTPAAITASLLISNPVAGFEADNNGFAVVLPPVPDTGVTYLAGALVFGIGTQSNNALGKATVMPTDPHGYLWTQYLGIRRDSVFDTGTNTMVLPGALLPTCSFNLQFFCPLVDTLQSATVVGLDLSSVVLHFPVKNFDLLGRTVVAAAIASPGSHAAPFFWGLPAFFGRTVSFAIDGATAAGKLGPFVAI
jgi:hypothetical protein